MRQILLLAALLCFALVGYAPSVCAQTSVVQLTGFVPFNYGIAGHALRAGPYLDISTSDQLSLIRDAGLGWYRTDFPQGTFEQLNSQFKDLLSESKSAKVNLLPILFPTTLSTDSLSTLYSKSYNYAREVAIFGGGAITTFELLNEVEVTCMIGITDGTLPTQYDNTCSVTRA